MRCRLHGVILLKEFIYSLRSLFMLFVTLCNNTTTAFSNRSILVPAIHYCTILLGALLTLIICLFRLFLRPTFDNFKLIVARSSSYSVLIYTSKHLISHYGRLMLACKWTRTTLTNSFSICRFCLGCCCVKLLGNINHGLICLSLISELRGILRSKLRHLHLSHL